MLQENDKIPTGLKGILVTPDEDHPQNNKMVSLTSLTKGKTVVLYFYPKDNTPGCTTEACNFRDHCSEFKNSQVEIIGVSKDSPKAHRNFIDKNALNFPLLSDQNGEICEAFGAWGEKSRSGKTYMGIIRSTFVLKNGKVLKVFPKVSPRNHVSEIREVLAV